MLPCPIGELQHWRARKCNELLLTTTSVGIKSYRILTNFERGCRAQRLDATKTHLFLSSSPVGVKFEMQKTDYQFYELDFDDHQEKVTEVAGEKQCSSALQQLIARSQAIGETNRSYDTALYQLEELADLTKKDVRTKSDV